MRIQPVSLPTTLIVVALCVVAALAVRYAVLEPAVADVPVPSLVTVELSMSEYTIEPREITVPAGGRVRLVVHNRGQLAHELVIAGLPFALTDIRPGDRVTVVFATPAPGSYEFACHHADHDERGMRGRLVVMGR